MATSPAPPAIPPRVRQLAAEFVDAKPMRRGSLSERAIKCGKPGCACAHDPKARHGPYHSLTRAVKGKTHSRFLTPGQADVARQQIDAGHEFRTQVDDYWEACEEWADMNWWIGQLPQRRLKKGAPNEPPKRDCPGNRIAHRPSSCPRIWISKLWKSPRGGRLCGWLGEPWNNR